MQRQALREYTNAKNYELIKVFKDEGISGGLEDRVRLAELFSFLKDKENKGVDYE